MAETPRRSRKLWLWIGVPVTLLVAAIAAGLILRGEYTTEQSAEREFTIDKDFTNVRKIMVRTNASKEIVTMGGTSEFIDQQWTEAAINAEGENLGAALLQAVLSDDPSWSLDLEGTLRVRTLDKYIGQNEITLGQTVQITPDKIESRTKLLEGSERLLDYSMLTRLSRDGDQTKVELELSQKIKTDAPWFAHAIARRRVRVSARTALKKQEEAMRQLIEDNADRAGIFPLQ